MTPATRRTTRGLAAVVAAAALAQAGAEAAGEPVRQPAPSPQIEHAVARQLDGDLRFELRLDRPVGADELGPRRVVCIELSPAAPSRRRACVSARDGRLRATLTAIDAAGVAAGPVRALGAARPLLSGRRLVLRAPAAALRVRLGRRVSWRAYVRWNAAPRCAPSCRQASGAQTLATRAPRLPAFARLHRLRLLATGDSMIQIIDGYLSRDLGRRPGAFVRSAAHVGTGISRPSELDWRRRARGQASGYKPDVTVVFLGANDGYPLPARSGVSAPCCGERWIAAYALRVEAMMRSYLRGGRSIVYWLTLPAPRRAGFVSIYRAVNVAIDRAARRAGSGVRVVDIARVFTPGWRFRQTIRFRGRVVDARQPDGVHLSLAGARVAATLIVDRLRADGVLR